MVIFYSYVSLPEGKQLAMSRDTSYLPKVLCFFQDIEGQARSIWLG